MPSAGGESSNYELVELRARANKVVILGQNRRAALSEIDNAKFSWFHAKVCVVAGVGFFTEAYDIFAINIASIMLGYVYGQDGQLSPKQDLGVKIATQAGTLVGQLLFGWLADQTGRKKMYGIELMIMIVGTFVQALSGYSPSINIFGILIFWRFIMGVGIGGDYPLSAVISAEFASTRIRGRMMTSVFAAQGWGNFGASLAAFTITTAYKETILKSSPTVNPATIDQMWRLLIGLGCAPGVIALYFRLTISESPRFTMDIERNIQQATADIKTVVKGESFDDDGDIVIRRVNSPRATWADFARYFGKWKNGKVLLGTCWSWFALDIAFYGLGLNSSVILEAIGFVTTPGTTSLEVYNNLINLAKGNLILAAAGLLPGYWFSFLFIDSWGRRPIQLMGFTILTVLFLIMGFGYDKLTATVSAKKAFVFFYCMANFFSNFGPNTTTFVIPGEIFPTRYRSTAHGISAASGKLGAIIAQVAFNHLNPGGGSPENNPGVKRVLQAFAFFMLSGIGSTLLLPETKNLTLEELSNEDQSDFVRDDEEAADRLPVRTASSLQLPLLLNEAPS